MNRSFASTSAQQRTYKLVYCAMFTVLITIGAFIKIPIPVVPFTLQFFFTLMAGLLLGSKWGALSVLLYAILGLFGLPIFASGGGFHYVFNPSFGYILGFAVGTYVGGWIVEHAKHSKTSTYLLANFVNLILVYAIGMLYYYIISNYVIHTPIGIWPLFLYCFILAVPGDICLCIVAALLTKKLRPLLG